MMCLPQSRKMMTEELEMVRNSPLLDADWYLQQYPDVEVLKIEPAEHYLWIGAQRRAHSDDSRIEYLDAGCADIAGRRTDCAVHHGARMASGSAPIADRNARTSAASASIPPRLSAVKVHDRSP